MKNVRNFMSEIGSFVSKNGCSIVLGAAAVSSGINLIKHLSSMRRQTEIGLIELKDVYDPNKVMDEFMAGMPTLIAQYRRTMLKRELTDEEIEEIERRIYFNKENLEDILKEKNLLK